MKKLLLLCFLASAPTWALQIVDVSGTQNAYATLALRDITVLSMSQGRIKTLRFNAGSLMVQQDDQNGRYFIKPASPAPVTVFVETEAGDIYTLLLQPKDIPADQIVLRSPGVPRNSAPSAIEKVGSHDSAVKNLILVMASGALPSDMRITSPGTELKLWAEARITHDMTYSGARVVGEKFRLTNTTQKELILAEQEFFKTGVLAVAIDDARLPPGSSTFVYIVRNKEANDE